MPLFLTVRKSEFLYPRYCYFFLSDQKSTYSFKSNKRIYAMQMRNEKRRFVLGILKLLLAHHPCCKRYDRDVAKIGRLRLCLGCLIFIPSALLVMILLFGNFLRPGLDYGFYIPVGVVFGLAQFLSLFFHIKFRLLKVLVKMALGIGVAFVLYGIYLLPIKAGYRFLIVIICVTVAGAVESIRIFRFRQTCKKCDSYIKIPDCEGLRAFSD